MSNGTSSLVVSRAWWLMDHSPPVLIVEDDPFILRVEARVALSLGLNPWLCADMAEGLRLAAEGGWALVLLDLNLPDAYGQPLLDAFLALPSLASTPVLCVSGDDGAVDWMPARVRARPGLGLLRKPFTRIILEECMQAAVRGGMATGPRAR